MTNETKVKVVTADPSALGLFGLAIITLVFGFAKWSNLSSFGLIMFWGLVLIAVYNVIVTKTLLKLRENK